MQVQANQEARINQDRTLKAHISRQKNPLTLRKMRHFQAVIHDSSFHPSDRFAVYICKSAIGHQKGLPLKFTNLTSKQIEDNESSNNHKYESPSLKFRLYVVYLYYRATLKSKHKGYTFSIMVVSTTTTTTTTSY